MTDEQLIEELQKDHAGDYGIDEACYQRLLRIAGVCGKDGEIAASLLDVVRRLLDL